MEPWFAGVVGSLTALSILALIILVSLGLAMMVRGAFELCLHSDDRRAGIDRRTGSDRRNRSRYELRHQP